MRKIKLLTAGLGLLAMLACAAIGATAAYLTDVRTVTNEFSFGSLQVEVFEAVFSAGGSGSRVLVPGSQVAKDPAVRNTGTVPCYLRATVTISDAGLGDTQSVLDFITMGPLNAENWRLAAGQSWGARQVTAYYIGGAGGVLEPGAETAPLFSSFSLNATAADNTPLLQSSISGFDIIVTVQAVQAEADGKTISSPESAFAQLMP